MSRVAKVGILVVALLLMGTAVQAAGPPQTSTVHTFPGGDAVDGSSAQLVRNSNGVTATINTNSLDPGTYTVWWIIWEDWESCSDAECGENDLGSATVGGPAAGQVVGASGLGNFAGHLNAGETPGPDLLIDNGPLVDPLHAEIHLIIRYHGPVNTEFMPAQISSFAGGCTPESSFGIGVGPFDCVDVQAVAFVGIP